MNGMSSWIYLGDTIYHFLADIPTLVRFKNSPHHDKREWIFSVCDRKIRKKKRMRVIENLISSPEECCFFFFFAPSPLKPSLLTTALTLSANSATELCRMLFATSSPASAEDITTGRRSAMRAQEGSSYVHLFEKLHKREFTAYEHV